MSNQNTEIILKCLFNEEASKKDFFDGLLIMKKELNEKNRYYEFKSPCPKRCHLSTHPNIFALGTQRNFLSYYELCDDCINNKETFDYLLCNSYIINSDLKTKRCMACMKILRYCYNFCEFCHVCWYMNTDIINITDNAILPTYYPLNNRCNTCDYYILNEIIESDIVNEINNEKTKTMTVSCANCLKFCRCGNLILKRYYEKCIICNLDVCIICNDSVFKKCHECNFCADCIPEYCTYGDVRVCNLCNKNKVNYLDVLHSDILLLITDYLDIYDKLNFMITTKKCDRIIFKHIMDSFTILCYCWGCGDILFNYYKCFYCKKKLCVSCVANCELCGDIIKSPQKYAFGYDNDESCSSRWSACDDSLHDLQYKYKQNREEMNEGECGWSFKCSMCSKRICHNCVQIDYNVKCYICFEATDKNNYFKEI